jgi:hypothetical protein
MNSGVKKPVQCANTGQAIVQKLQGYSIQLFWRVKAALIGLSEWLALLFPF